MLLHSVKNHPWLGKFLLDVQQRAGFEFRGIITEVSDDGKRPDVYVQFVYNDGVYDYAYVPRTAFVEPAVVHVQPVVVKLID